jgi:hypothetical protein
VFHVAHDDAANHRHLTSVERATRVGARARVAGLALVLLGSFAAPSAVLGADPTPVPNATAPPSTCSERFTDDGPAGVDLRLGCIVSEVVGLYTAGQDAAPPPLSTYAIVLIALGVGAAGIAVLAGRLLHRQAGRRMAPVLADAWWVCASCRSVNAAGVLRCYSCGSTQPDGPTLRTDAAPATPQSFGSTRKRG